ncbi:MAG: hypothetical protein JWL69_3930 [Phycisphaerales bacterium]|jgi:hypothetical protein|nr:hypothetical protein [Phycisphaerales bacterium]MDB5357288.1 hypothetical protein [Phycisphaerales bacterium]
MFYLGGTSFPETREQLISAVTEGIRGLVTLPAGREAVKIEGGEYPSFGKVTIDLTGARADIDRLPPEPKGVGQIQPAVSATQLEIVGRPLYVREAAVDLSLSARDALFAYDRDAQGRPILVLMRANDGHVAVEIKKQDAEALLLGGARDAAKQQGVQIIEAQLSLTQLDERSVAAEVRTKAKKLFVTAVVTIRGKLRVDDALIATVSDLTCAGQGMLGDLAAKFIGPKLAEVNGRSFPLAALSLGDVKLHDLRMLAGDPLRVTAAFGS